MEATARFYEDHLEGNLLPFWRDHCLDRECGGYFTHLDRTGKVYNDGTKFSAMQARLIYAFTAGHARQPDRGFLQLAEHGVSFLIRSFWDQANGGWHRSVRRNGQAVEKEKHLFDQSYVLIGLAEYYGATRDAKVLDVINRTYDLLERHAWDASQSGYFESFQSDWSTQSRRKTVCIQVDMLRAVLALSSTTAQLRFRERARQLADLIVQHTFDRDAECVLEVFHPDWRYSPMATRDRVLIGHNLKVAWLLLRVHELDPHPEYVRTAIRMVEFCLRHGWDAVHGGFFHYVFRTGALASPKKVWWPECEGLHALVALHRLTGETRYWDYFSALTGFVSKAFIDREHPEWFTSCHPDGTPLDDHKGGAYKSAYHTVQACVAVLQHLSPEPQPPAAPPAASHAP